MSGVNLLLSDARGVYIPRDFVQCYTVQEWAISTTLANEVSNPDNEFYWESWQTILDCAKYTDKFGAIWQLYQDGDLFAICYELMTDDEKEAFGFID